MIRDIATKGLRPGSRVATEEASRATTSRRPVLELQHGNRESTYKSLDKSADIASKRGTTIHLWEIERVGATTETASKKGDNEESIRCVKIIGRTG